MTRQLAIQWDLAADTAWGRYALNLVRHWPIVGGAEAVIDGEIAYDSLIESSPLQYWAMSAALAGSVRWRAKQKSSAQAFPGISLDAWENGLTRVGTPAAALPARTRCAVVVFDDTTIADAVAMATPYALLIAPSRWNEAILRAHGINNVATCGRGIDLALFHPGPRSGALDGRFAIFSGGRLDLRCGQDLSLLAFRAFASRHPDAVLVTAWDWEPVDRRYTVDLARRVSSLRYSQSGKVDPIAWAKANGIAETAIIDLGAQTPHRLAEILRDVDVGLFPNRCSATTDTLAMQCMAAGTPVIVSNNTGHQDLLATGAPYPLTRQSPVAIDGIGTEGWGESDIDEIVESLEQIWTNRAAAATRGLAGSAAMQAWGWRTQINHLAATLAPL